MWIGRAVNQVDREADPARVKIEFLNWSESNYGQAEALFRVTNPGPRPVLVWNVRQQVSSRRSVGVGNSWETVESDYPGRGWESSTIAEGGSVHFPMLPPTNGQWRLCLLYSREVPGSQAPNRRFGGAYESIGPSIQQPN